VNKAKRSPSRDALRLVDFAICFSYSVRGDRAANRMLNRSVRSACRDVLRRRVVIRSEVLKSRLLERSRRVLHIVELAALVEVLSRVMNVLKEQKLQESSHYKLTKNDWRQKCARKKYLSRVGIIRGASSARFFPVTSCIVVILLATIMRFRISWPENRKQ
jgi:hypothetical protein